MISTRGRYALRMVIDLAQNQQNDYVALKDVAARQDISKKYLEQIIPVLNRSGILLTARGLRGGYRLAKKPEEITVYDILKETEGGLAPVSCISTENNICPRQNGCITLPLWQGLQKVTADYLKGITIASIIENAAENGADNYSI